MTRASTSLDPRSLYAVVVGGANGDGAWRGLVTIVELITPRPYIFQPAGSPRLIDTVIFMSDRLLSQANPDLHLPPHNRTAKLVPCLSQPDHGVITYNVPGHTQTMYRCIHMCVMLPGPCPYRYSYQYPIVVRCPISISHIDLPY